MDITIQKQIIELIKREVIPAIGCTEPMAVALAVAKASETLAKIPQKIEVFLSANVLKNAMGVGIPGTGMIRARRLPAWPGRPAGRRQRRKHSARPADPCAGYRHRGQLHLSADRPLRVRLAVHRLGYRQRRAERCAGDRHG